MKKILLTITMLTIIGLLIVNAQSELIISENFQEWEATEDTDESSCSAGVTVEESLKRSFNLVTTEGIKEIPVTLIKCAIAPTCESRRVEDSGGATDNFPGVTPGWVMLNKISGATTENYIESPDTLGEMIFGPIPHIDSIIVAHSATGSKRGIRVFYSYNGEDWVRATEDELWDGEDCQLGDVNTIGIYESEVYIKFTSGFKMTDSTSQFTRIHNIDVYGIPGKASAVNDISLDNMLSIYPNPASDFIHIDLAKDISNANLQITNIQGKILYSCNIDQQKSNIDISKLKSGMYIVQLTHKNQMYVKQLIVK